jgi:cysteine-rich repeat protein
MGAPGPTGPSGQTSLVAATAEPPGANCAAGGMKVSIGIDDDGDRVLDAGEIDMTTFVCNGLSAPGADGGTGTTCTQPTDCPAPTNPCQRAICRATGVCDVANQPPGTACTEQTGIGTVCNGNGACVQAGCHDGVLESPPEVCDDGNDLSGDGCSFCAIDPGFFCTAMSPSRCRMRRFSANAVVFNYVLGFAPTIMARESGTFGVTKAPPPAGSSAAGELCTPPNIDLTGQIVLARRGGGCTFYQKALNAQNAGAVGIIVQNIFPGIVPVVSVEPPMATDPPVTIPLALITLFDGDILVDVINNGPLFVTWLPLDSP